MISVNCMLSEKGNTHFFTHSFTLLDAFRDYTVQLYGEFIRVCVCVYVFLLLLFFLSHKDQTTFQM